MRTLTVKWQLWLSSVEPWRILPRRFHGLINPAERIVVVAVQVGSRLLPGHN